MTLLAAQTDFSEAGELSVLNELHHLIAIDDLTGCGCDGPSDLEFLRPPRFPELQPGAYLQGDFA